MRPFKLPTCWQPPGHAESLQCHNFSSAPIDWDMRGKCSHRWGDPIGVSCHVKETDASVILIVIICPACRVSLIRRAKISRYVENPPTVNPPNESLPGLSNLYRAATGRQCPQKVSTILTITGLASWNTAQSCPIILCPVNGHHPLFRQPFHWKMDDNGTKHGRRGSMPIMVVSCGAMLWRTSSLTECSGSGTHITAQPILLNKDQTDKSMFHHISQHHRSHKLTHQQTCDLQHLQYDVWTHKHTHLYKETGKWCNQSVLTKQASNVVTIPGFHWINVDFDDGSPVSFRWNSLEMTLFSNRGLFLKCWK